MLSKCLCLSILMLMIPSLFACGPREITFPDTNLEAAVREAIDKPEGTILPSDLEALTSLDASKRNITDLTGLEHCTTLSVLRLYRNQISDLSPLASLTNLRYIDVEDNPLNDQSVNVYIPQLETRGAKVIY